MAKYEEYEHHGKQVTVRSDLKGKHREHCLCWSCVAFNSETREANCRIARAVYANCVEFGLVTPVWECPHFVAKEMRDG